MPETDLNESDRDELVDKATELRKAFADIPETERTSEQDAQVRKLHRPGEGDRRTAHHRGLGRGPGSQARRVQRNADDPSATRGGGIGNADRRSFGEMLITEEYVDWMVRGPSSTLSSNFEGKGFLDQLLKRAVQDWGSSGSELLLGAGNLLPVGQPIAPVPRQARLYLRDLIPKMTTTLAAIPYVQELNPTLRVGVSGGRRWDQLNATLILPGRQGRSDRDRCLVGALQAALRGRRGGCAVRESASALPGGLQGGLGVS